MMKQIFTLVTVLAFAAGTAYAGCGKKVSVTGTLSSYDEDSKSLTVEGSEKGITLTPTTEIKDAEGNAVEISELVGKKVEVVHEHNKADSVSPSAS